jgi:hypothetical protein
MINKSKLLLIAAAAVIAIASPAFARSDAAREHGRIAHHQHLYNFAPGAGISSPFNSDSPAAAGGGSTGYNEHNPTDY